MLEDGRVVAHGTHEELLEQLRPVSRDRREGHARPGVPRPQAARGGGGGPVSAGSRRARRGACARPAAGGRKLRGLIAAAAPLPLARAGDVRRAGRRRPPRRWRRRRWPSSPSTTASQRHDVGDARPRSWSRSWSRRSSTRSRPTRRPTWSAGSASARCRTCASSCSRTCSAVDRLLLAQPRGRDHLAHDERRRGARPARRATGWRRCSNPALTLIGVVVILLVLDCAAGAAHVPRAAAACDRRAGLPDRFGRRLPAHARADRAITGYLQETLSGISVVRALARSSATSRDSRSSTTTTATRT